jgi:hypothetical protein
VTTGSGFTALYHPSASSSLLLVILAKNGLVAARWPLTCRYARSARADALVRRRPVRCRVAGRRRRAWDGPAELRAAACGPRAAGADSYRKTQADIRASEIARLEKVLQDDLIN